MIPDYSITYSREGKSEDEDATYVLETYGFGNVWLSIRDQNGEHTVGLTPKQARKLAKRLNKVAALYDDKH